MLTGNLFHVAFRTQNLEKTVSFYTQVLGLTLDVRPPFDFPGAWLKPSIPGSTACLHIYAGDAALEADGSAQQGTGVVDHLSVLAHGLTDYREKFLKFGLPWRENIVPNMPLSQLFVYDPNGILLELTFHTNAEGAPHGPITPDLQYQPQERWFDASAYERFPSEVPSAITTGE